MDPSQYHEQVAELKRQIELVEEFIRQRKKLAKKDSDVRVKLRLYRTQLDELLRLGSLEELSDDIAAD
jgi:hypothetical protein